MKKLHLLLFLIVLVFTTMAQSPGDTVVVQAWDYNSSNRDTVIDFSAINGLGIERVILRYAMRCKGARVSTVSNRNLGCGEWDYSCNTYVHAPNMADSISRTTNKYNIYPSTNPDSIYSSSPTYKYVPAIHSSRVVSSITNEDTVIIGAIVDKDTSIIYSRARNGKTVIHYAASELIAAGLVAGDIKALSLHSFDSVSVYIKNLRLGIKHASANVFAQLDTSDLNGFTNVYHYHTNFLQGENKLYFHSPFNWDGTSDILVELTYEGKPSNDNLWISTYNASKSYFSADDYALNMFPNNYVEAPTFKGISGSNARTVEAWIRTTGSGEIATWGTNLQGQKQSFWVNGSGNLRLEVHSGYVVGSSIVNDGKWHHVAYTFGGNSMNDVKLYVDGNLETNSAINNIVMNTGNFKNFEISRGFHNRYFTGQIDNIRVWSADLSAATIKKWMHINYDSSHPNINDLKLNYYVESENPNIRDVSAANPRHNGNFMVVPSFSFTPAKELFKGFNKDRSARATFFQGSYISTIVNDTIYDSIPHTSFTVEERSIISRAGTVLSDSIGSTISKYYPADNELYDLNGQLQTTIPSAQLDTIGQRSLTYYQRNPQKVELMSFVTPYGINLDLGQNGKAWHFDVSDLMPVLKGNRRMTMERGGQWQEEMDLRFYFIVGTPPEDVLDIRQIWKVDQRSYSSINNNTYFAPRTIEVDTSAKRYKINSAITGHGQQGEFIQRLHSIIANGSFFTRFVWTECAVNPIYPQGGTWVYDRAGWCPGQATDIKEYDITNLITGNTLNVDYDVISAAGASNYIVSNQLVQYGAKNFSNDARLERVIRPTNETEFGRRNPSCYNPVVVLKNTGSNTLTTADIEISVNGNTPITHTWTGNLNFLEEANVNIPVAQAFWSSGSGGNNSFEAKIVSVNNGTDQYVHNNSYRSTFAMPDTLPSQIRMILRTNLAAFQNSYTIKNSSGTIVFQKSGLSASTFYNDPVTLSPGCYQLSFRDSGDDGLYFFANNSGSGFFRIANSNNITIKDFNPDFGDGIEYYFRVDQTTGLEENTNEAFEVYPNPTQDLIFIQSSYADYQWSLRDALGKEVNAGAVKKNIDRLQISVDGLKKGMYYLMIRSGEKTENHKISIQ